MSRISRGEPHFVERTSIEPLSNAKMSTCFLKGTQKTKGTNEYTAPGRQNKGRYHVLKGKTVREV